MVSLEQAGAMAAALPEVTEAERFRHRTWFVGTKAFAWERPFSKADLKRFGAEAQPAGPIFAVSTADLAEKEAVLAAGHQGVFTIAHFDDFPAVLIQLDLADEKVVAELLEDGWLAVAPKALVKQHYPQS